MTDTEIAPASREDVERLKAHAQSLIANLNTTEENFDILQTVLSLIAWGEAAERDRDKWKDLVSKALESVDRGRAEAAESRAAQAEKEHDQLAEIVTYIVGAPVKTTSDAGCSFSFATEQHRRDFDRLLGDLLCGPIAGQPNATDRAEQAEAAMRGMTGAIRTAFWWMTNDARHAPHCDREKARGNSYADDGSNCTCGWETTFTALCQASATPSAAVALAEREVVEAAWEFVNKGTVLTSCNRGPCQRVIEHKDNSDPQARLIRTFKTLNVARAKAEGEPATPSDTASGERTQPTDYAGMDSPTLLSAMGDDASKWAAAFCQIAKKLGHGDIDEGWMIGWFANAIEHSSDARRFRRQRGEQ